MKIEYFMLSIQIIDFIIQIIELFSNLRFEIVKTQIQKLNKLQNKNNIIDQF